jgi:hypothetical protein
MTLIWKGELRNTLDMLRYMRVAVGRADRGQRDCMQIFLEILLGKRPTGRPWRRWTLEFLIVRFGGGWN